MKNDDGFIYDEEAAGLSEEDERVLKGLHNERAVDPVTGRKQKKINVLNKKKLSKQEMDEFFLDY
ncbi:TPA: hypothetical protein HA251_08100 [Candidatus Woesearchaeota archaeon]|nr:hypothetical protein [Candidatus Woesearchaeota archaeon]